MAKKYRVLIIRARLLARKHRVAHHAASLFWLVVNPIVPMLCIVALWYYGLYRNNLHFEERFENIAAVLWAALMAGFYLSFLDEVRSTALEKFKACLDAVYDFNHEEYMKLRQKHIEPLEHVKLIIFSWLTIFAILGIDYPSFWGGLMCIGCFGYAFGLVFFWLWELDHPFSGLWRINVPQCWKEINHEKWYHERRMRLLREFTEKQSGRDTKRAA